MRSDAALWLVVTVLVGLNVISAKNEQYVGAPLTKAFHFPWMINVHFEGPGKKQLIGSGSIITHKYAFSSMDCFVRKSGIDSRRQRRYYHDIRYWAMYSGSVWGEPYFPRNTVWWQRKEVHKMYMWSSTQANAVLTFDANYWPNGLFNYERSPFGLSMAITLLKVHDNDLWSWRRTTLPLPYPFEASGSSGYYEYLYGLPNIINKLEQSPGYLECLAGGWRNGDRRLVAYSLVYVPFKQCEDIYCGYHQRVCNSGWPVRGVHVCFKSLTYDDLCWRDQGSALYCPKIRNSSIAILTTSPTCGYEQLPGVFTLVNYGFKLLEHTAKSGDLYASLSQYELEFFFGPPPAPALIPVPH